MPEKYREQRVRRDDGSLGWHREKPSRKITGPVKWLGEVTMQGQSFGHEWECGEYYGCLKRFDSGSPLGGGGAYATLSISHKTNDAKHDWREFQQLKNLLLGQEWECLEMYPAESRLVDPSNRYFLWCFPRGAIPWGFDHRRVLDMEDSEAPQRPFPIEEGG